jgi:hypothetical protein
MIYVLIKLQNEDKTKEYLENLKKSQITMWDVRPKSAWFDYNINDIIGTYWAPSVKSNPIYCRKKCQDNIFCTSYLYDFDKLCKIFKIDNPIWIDGVGGQWGGGIRKI